MKYKLHIPTEQFGFIEAEIGEDNDIFSATRVIEKYNEIKQAWSKPIQTENGLGMTPGAGLPDKEFNKILDSFLLGEAMTSEEYANMNSEQWAVIQEVKKAQKRLKAKEQ